MIDDPTPVRRCVCAEITFADLKAAGVQTVEEAGERFGAGLGCGSCLPYLRAMVATGRVAFPVLPRDE
ncbi:MAG: (2Fe-2S)-binding protein [Fimbriimonas sp.]